MNRIIKCILLLVSYGLVGFGVYYFTNTFDGTLELNSDLIIPVACGVVGVVIGLIASLTDAVDKDYPEEEQEEPIKQEEIEEQQPVVEEEKAEKPQTSFSIDELDFNLEEEETDLATETSQEQAEEKTIVQEEASIEEEQEEAIVDDEPCEEMAKELKVDATEPFVIISPLGPRPQSTSEVEKQEEPEAVDQQPQDELEETKELEEPEEELDIMPEFFLDDEDEEEEASVVEEESEEPVQLEEQEEEPVQPEEQEELPQPEPELFESKLTETQANYINQSKVSFIDEESGLPQFKVTEKYKIIEDEDTEEEKSEDFEGWDVQAEKRDRVSRILNGIVTVLLIVVALLLVYVIYMQFIG